MATRKLSVKVIKSVKGEFTFPTIMVDGQPKSLTCYPDREVLLPKEFQDNDYVLDAIEKGLVVVRDSDAIPQAPKPFPEIIETDAMAKGWLTTLLNGEYTDQMKSYLQDWRKTTAMNKGRIITLKNRILPLVQCAIEREAGGQNRADLLDDLRRVEQYILKEEWQWDVQSAGRRSP